MLRQIGPISLGILLFFLAGISSAQAQTLPTCSDSNEVSEIDAFSFYSLDQVDSIPLTSIRDTLRFDSVPGFMILAMEEYHQYYIPITENGASTGTFYYLNWFAPIDEAQLLEDEELGDLIVLYGNDRNGRSSVRYGDGWSNEQDYFTFIDLQRGGYYGQYEYHNRTESWGESYSDTLGNEIYYSDLNDTLTDPDFYPSDHFNVHLRMGVEEFRCQLIIDGRTVELDCVYRQLERTEIDYLKGGKGLEAEGDSCHMYQKYYRDLDGFYIPIKTKN